MPSASSTLLTLLAAAAVLPGAHAQSAARPAEPAKPATTQAAPTAPATGATSTPPSGSSAASGADLVGYRLPLLREGSIVTRVLGDITLDPDEQHWVFRPIQPESGNLRREFVLLPSSTLAEMLRTRRLTPSPVEFEVTGRVSIYRGRNYLFPELAPPIVRFDTRPSQVPAPDAKPETSPNGQSKFVPPASNSGRADPSIGKDDDATVAAIERRLEQRVGRTPIGKPTGESEDGAESKKEASTKESLPEPGTRLQLRSGRLLRDPQAGSWRFVPEQVAGKGDASMEILPCLLLERLEATTRESDAPPNILISGTVIIFEGNAYLMPTSFRRVREGRGIGR